MLGGLIDFRGFHRFWIVDVISNIFLIAFRGVCEVSCQIADDVHLFPMFVTHWFEAN